MVWTRVPDGIPVDFALGVIAAKDRDAERSVDLVTFDRCHRHFRDRDPPQRRSAYAVLAYECVDRVDEDPLLPSHEVAVLHHARREIVGERDVDPLPIVAAEVRNRAVADPHVAAPDADPVHGDATDMHVLEEDVLGTVDLDAVLAAHDGDVPNGDAIRGDDESAANDRARLADERLLLVEHERALVHAGGKHDRRGARGPRAGDRRKDENGDRRGRRNCSEPAAERPSAARKAEPEVAHDHAYEHGRVEDEVKLDEAERMCLRRAEVLPEDAGRRRLVAAREPLVELRRVLDDVIALNEHSGAERADGPRMHATPLWPPDLIRGGQSGQREKDGRVVGEVHPLEVEDEAERAAAIAGTAVREPFLLQGLRDVLGLVRRHDGDERRKGDVEAALWEDAPAHRYLTEPASR